ncbi:dihydrolipoyl dehydrogenase [Candidatus Marinamargulisbacteria bacterium SCGC AG-343-D04]|nr:dihydrolipoyl dehydrogenase [Candidatus Marinamargulisbacteria bacterium SCGC AG-343-D04]
MDKKHYDLVVIGGGPGGYAAAFYAASHGKKVCLVDKREVLGGVCLNEGCIPSKALIHATEVLSSVKEAKEFGITFDKPKIDIKQLKKWKEGIISKLNKGIEMLCEKKKVTFLHGRGYFEDSKTLRVETKKGQQFLSFDDAIIAVGSHPALPAAFDLGNKRIMTSKTALDIEDVPKSLLVVGGGYIGMELGSVYAALGSKVTVIEAMDSILMGADADLVRPVMKHAKENFDELLFSTKVSSMATKGKTISVKYKTSDNKAHEKCFDKVLVSVGRKPNSDNLGLKNTEIKVDDKGFIQTKTNQQTDDAHIYAIGDIAGGILLAHKASKEAVVAVEAILGRRVTNENMVIPCVVFTDPEVAWCGVTEEEARQQKLDVEVSKFSWAASGRALSINRTDGMTKLIIDKQTERILGVGIVGAGAGELIAEGCLAVSSGLTAEDLAETVHAHPTLSETLMESAELFFGHSAHAYNPKKEK